MELNIGCQCEYDDCHIHDYLPFLCDKCNKYFCFDHKDYINHKCVKYTDNLQPLIKRKTSRKRYVCSHSKCKLKNQVNIKCFKCNKNYCLLHRYPEKHDCNKVILNN